MMFFVSGVYLVALSAIFRPKNGLTLVVFNLPTFCIGIGIIAINYKSIAGIA